MNQQPPKTNPTHQTISTVCVVIGIAAAMGLMFALGISGAIPGAVFGGLGGLTGALVGWLITLALPKPP
ncbi:MAG: hypothetical protein L0211_25145 [Planctomycetaceae bacterium]|nr:hypothetical protein [Planctomycetaceae bacterium]